MGKARIFGSGSGIPVNAVKVTEYAGEDIPANCFVEKKSGTAEQSLKSTISTGAGNLALWLTDNLVCYYNYAGYLMTFLDGVQVQTTSVSDSGNFYTSYDWPCVILEDQKKVIFGWQLDGDTTSTRKSYCVMAWKDDGTFTATTSTLTTTVASHYIFLASGRYSGREFYAVEFNNRNTSSTTRYQIGTWTLNASNQLVRGATTNIATTASRVNRAIWIPEANSLLIGKSESTYVGKFTPSSGTPSWYKSLSIYLVQSLMYSEGTKCYVYKDGYIYFAGISEKPYYTVLNRINMANGELQTYTVYTDDIAEALDDETVITFIYGICDCPYYENSIFIAVGVAGDSDHVTNNEILIFNCATGKVTKATELNSWVLTDKVYKNASDLRMFDSRMVNGHWALAGDSSSIYSWFEPSVYIATSSTVYGYTVAPIKQYKQGSVYAVNTNYTNEAYTTYGISEALVAQIVDDSVDAIQREVTTVDDSVEEIQQEVSE